METQSPTRGGRVSLPGRTFTKTVSAAQSATGAFNHFQNALRNYRHLQLIAMVNRRAPIATRVAGGQGRRGGGWIAESAPEGQN